MANLAESQAGGFVRVLAIALIQRPADGGWLAVYLTEAGTNRSYYRPPGGGVEVGERTEETIRREMLEEFGATVRTGRLLSVLENIFTIRGQIGHEVVFAWECQFEDESMYQDDVLFGMEDNGEELVAHWVQPQVLAHQGIDLYPDGLPELLLSLDGGRA